MMNRRMTLGPLVDNQNNGQQMAPGTATKASRMSLGPRMSMGPAKRMQRTQENNLVKDMAGMSIGSGRPSMGMRRQSTAPRYVCMLFVLLLRMNDSRSSVYGRSSMAASGGDAASGVPLKETRNIRDKQWQLMAIRLLIKFLAEAGYDRTISAKILSQPSAKDLQHIFKFLYERLDPDFNWEDKKFEDEVPVLIKQLKYAHQGFYVLHVDLIRYPFADQINKAQFFTIGVVHKWPALLAMLVWMVELILCCDQIRAVEEDDAQFENQPIRIFYNFVLDAYQIFLDGSDNFEELEQELAAGFRMLLRG